MTWEFTHHVLVFNRAVATREWGELVDLFSADAVRQSSPCRWHDSMRAGTRRATIDDERLRRLVVTFGPPDET